MVSRVLSAANMVRNNPRISPLTSLSHAVHQVGFQKIRRIAVSMMLLESAAGATHCPEQRDAAAHAFVVIKAGTAQGIEAKHNLVISRGGKVLAQAVVSSSQENYAIAQIVTGSLEGNLNKGDLATFAQ